MIILESLFHQCPLRCVIDPELPSPAWKRRPSILLLHPQEYPTQWPKHNKNPRMRITKAIQTKTRGRETHWHCSFELFELIIRHTRKLSFPQPNMHFQIFILCKKCFHCVSFIIQLKISRQLVKTCEIQEKHKSEKIGVELTFHNITVQMTVSEHGGVVREPRYRP